MKQIFSGLAGGLVFGLISLILPACSHSPADQFSGSYVFKTSGTVTVEVTSEVPTTDGISLILGSHVYELTPESGRMDVRGDGNNTLFVSMNVLGGDVQVFEAELTADGFQIPPTKRQIRLSALGALEVIVSGNARLLGDTLHIDFVYTGGQTVLPGIRCSVTDSDVVCVATKSRPR